MEIAHALRDMHPVRGIVITHQVARMEDRSKNGEARRRSGEQSPDGDAQFNLNAYYLFSHIMLGQSRGQFLFSEGFLKVDILDRCRPTQRAFPHPGF